MERTKILIIGSGPAGYTAAIYASRASLNPILYEGLQPGGQLTTTTIVENYSGFPNGIDGNELMNKMREQAQSFGTQIRTGVVVSIDTTKRPFIVTIEDGNKIETEAIIFATGASAKYLGISTESKYIGVGVSACATCDGFFYRGKNVAVVGGGDTAVEDALYLSHLANKVYLVVRRDVLRASQIMQHKLSKTKNIEILFNCQVVEFHGNNELEYVTLVFNKGTSNEKFLQLNVNGVFVAIGHSPNTNLLPNIECDKFGYIVTKEDTTQTSIDGIFACGDVADARYRQAITAAASGCKAAIDAEHWLNERL